MFMYIGVKKRSLSIEHSTGLSASRTFNDLVVQDYYELGKRMAAFAKEAELWTGRC